MEQNRITPRSPRAALEPERVPMPTRRSRACAPSARRRRQCRLHDPAHPGRWWAAAPSWSASSASRRPGPLAEDKIVNIPRGLGIRDIADLLVREGVIDQPWIFIGGVVVLKARDDLKFGEYQFAKQASLRDVIDTIIEGKVVQHQITDPGGADLRADRRSGCWRTTC